MSTLTLIWYSKGILDDNQLVGILEGDDVKEQTRLAIVACMEGVNAYHGPSYPPRWEAGDGWSRRSHFGERIWVETRQTNTLGYPATLRKDAP